MLTSDFYLFIITLVNKVVWLIANVTLLTIFYIFLIYIDRNLTLLSSLILQL